MFETQLFLPLGVRKVFEAVGRGLDIHRQIKPASPVAAPPPSKAGPEIWKHGIVLSVVRHPRARRYLLRLQADGVARLVIPQRGSRREALLFLERNEAWLLKRFREWQTRPVARAEWQNGAEFPFRGEMVHLRVDAHGEVVKLRFADEVLEVRQGADYRWAVSAHLRVIATRELPARTRELARVHGVTISRVTVRGQKTRWGSCSARGTISLNWRLIHAPPSVQDYLIIHELMHRRQMNHSARFWKLVEQACPDYKAAERWLKRTRLDTLE